MASQLIVSLALLLGSTAACENEPSGPVREAAESYRQGAYGEAVRTFEAARVRAPEDLRIALNLGLALFAQAEETGEESERQLIYLRALELFALGGQSADDRIAGESSYAMGNCLVAMGRLGEAALAYRQALLRRPGDEDARYNLEVVLRRLQRRGGGRPEPSASSSAVPEQELGGSVQAESRARLRKQKLEALERRSSELRRESLRRALRGEGVEPWSL